jgi:hypothetical protein
MRIILIQTYCRCFVMNRTSNWDAMLLWNVFHCMQIMDPNLARIRTMDHRSYIGISVYGCDLDVM